MDLGNLKILLELSTQGAINSLKNVNDALSKTAKNANIKLNIDDKSVAALTKQLAGIVGAVKNVSTNVGTGLVDGMKKSAEAGKVATKEIQQQVALSSDLEALFKEMAATLRGIAESQEQISKAKGRTKQNTKEQKDEEQKTYDLVRLREKGEEKVGNLASNEASVYKQMERILLSLVDIDKKHSTELSKQLQEAMRYGGVTREQLTYLEGIIARMKKAQKEEEKAAKQQSAAAKKRQAAARKQAQLETTILRIETRLLGMDEHRLQESTKLMVQKMRAGQITQEEATKLGAILAHEQAILNAEKKRSTVTEQTNVHLGKQSAILSQIKSYLGMYISVLGAVNLVKNIVRITGEFEAQHVALRAILQDVAAADRIFYQLQELAVKSPFTFRNLTEYAKQLSAFSVPIDEIYDTTKRLADVSACLGVDMSRIILAYGQIRSASFLRGQEVRQLTEAGIPVLQELAKQFQEIEGEAISVGKVFDRISARQVPFEMIEKMFKDLTSEGGKFYQMQEILAETVKGKVSNLQDAWEIMLSKVGEDNDKFIKGVLDGVTNLIKNYEKLAVALEAAAVGFGVYRTAAMAAGQAQVMQALILADTGKKVTQLRALLTVFGQGLAKIPARIGGIISKIHPVAAALAAASAALVILIAHIRKMNEHIRETDKITSKAIATAENSKSNIHYYIKQLKEAKEGTEEYNKARQAVIDNSGSYISATDAERLSLQNVDDVWVNICKHIEEATKLQAMQSVTADASAKRQEAQLDVMDKLTSYTQNHKLSREDFNFVAAYIRGEKSYEEFYRSDVAQKGRIFQRAAAWKDDYDKAERIYRETLSRAEQNLGALYGSGEPAATGGPKPLSGWRERVDNYLKAAGNTRGLKVEEDTNLADFVEGSAKALDDLRKALDLTPKSEAEYSKIESDIEFYQKLSEAIYGAGNTEFSNNTKLTKQNAKDAEQARREQVDAIKQAVQDLKEAKKWYDQLTPLIGKDNARSLLASFNFAVPGEGFGAAFQNYANQLVSLGEDNAARDVLNWANGREIGDVVDAAKAIEKYAEALEDLDAQTKRLNLSGFAQELDKIIVDADSKNRQLETNWAQKAEELEKAKGGWIQRYRVENEEATAEQAEYAWEKFYAAQTQAAKDAIDTQVEYNRKVAQEQINDKAAKWVEDMMKAGNIDLTNMNDKSLGQMNVLISRLRSLISDGALANLIPEELKADAALLNVSFGELLDNVEKIVNTKVGDVQVERMKKILGNVSSVLDKAGLPIDTRMVEDAYAEVVESERELNEAREEYYANADKYLDDSEKYIESLRKLLEAQKKFAEAQGKLKWAIVLASAQAFGSALERIGDNMSKIGEARSNDRLANAGRIVSEIGSSLQAFTKGGVVGLAIHLLDRFVESIVKAEEYNRKMTQTNNEWALSVARLRNEYELLQEGLNTLFGDASMAKMSGWAGIIREQGKAIRDFNASGAGDLAKLSLKTWDANWWQELWGNTDQYMNLASLVPQLFGPDGAVNFDYLDEFIGSDYFNMLSDEWQNTLKQMQEANNAYVDATKQMADYLKGIFGDVGASIASALISRFEETGQVALDTGDIISNVAKKFIDDWTQSFLITNYLSSLSDTISSVWSDQSLSMDEQVNQSLALMRDSLAAMSDSLPGIQDFYEKLDEQYHWTDNAGDDIGDAIKTAMVEQNSSLIAGYINSMRADLTMQRNEIMRNISPAVTNISNGFNQHLVYMESVAGNVANIWARLDVLTTAGSGWKINTRI